MQRPDVTATVSLSSFLPGTQKWRGGSRTGLIGGGVLSEGAQADKRGGFRVWAWGAEGWIAEPEEAGGRGTGRAAGCEKVGESRCHRWLGVT